MEGDGRRMAVGIHQAGWAEVSGGATAAVVISFEEARRKRVEAGYVIGGSGYGHRRECLVGDVVSLGFETVGLCAVTFLVIGLTLVLLAIPD
jgi:hypothetical protein